MGLVDPSDHLGIHWDKLPAPTAPVAYFYWNVETRLVLEYPYGVDLPVACLREVYRLFDEPLDSCGAFPAFVAFPENFGVRADRAVETRLTTWTRHHSRGIWIHSATEIRCFDWVVLGYVERLG